jgi:hypothetical protein
MPSEEVKMPRVEKMITNKGTTLLTSAMTARISSEELVEQRNTQDSYCEHERVHSFSLHNLVLLHDSFS